MNKCEVSECKNAYYSKGFCKQHYDRKRRRGTLDVWIPKNTLKCTVSECQSKQKDNDLCGKHSKKLRETGTLEWIRGNDEWRKKQSEAHRSKLSKIDPFRYESQRGYHAVNIVNDVKYKAKQRGKLWGLTHEQAYRLIIGDCIYCGHKPSWPKTRNGIDRYNNSIGYTPENSVSCCFSCNSAKGTRSFHEFREWINKVYQNLK